MVKELFSKWLSYYLFIIIFLKMNSIPRDLLIGVRNIIYCLEIIILLREKNIYCISITEESIWYYSLKLKKLAQLK